MKNVDEAIRRRLHLVPFLVTIPPNERDPALKDKLKAEWPAILRWMIDGCLECQHIGLAPPACVLDATKAYLSDEDDIGQWIAARLERKPRAQITQAALFADWCSWASPRGLFVGTSKRFGNILVERGYHRDRKNLGQIFEGIILRPLAPPE